MFVLLIIIIIIIIQGLMTYLEIGPNTRVRTNIIPSADRVEYAEVNHTQPQNSVKNDVGKFTKHLYISPVYTY